MVQREYGIQVMVLQLQPWHGTLYVLLTLKFRVPCSFMIEILMLSFSLFMLQDEKIELCRFSKDGTKPFLFCSVQRGMLVSLVRRECSHLCDFISWRVVQFVLKSDHLYTGNKPLTVVWDICTWKKIGHKRLLRKPASIMSISLDGKYLAL